jgi:hypothetical protein
VEEGLHLLGRDVQSFFKGGKTEALLVRLEGEEKNRLCQGGRARRRKERRRKGNV